MGVIESRIFDSLGRELPGVRVDLFNENGTRIDTDVTPTQDGRPTTPGRYRFDNLAPGKYTIKAVGRGLDGYNRPDDYSVRDFTIIDDLASIGEAQILAKIQDGTLETQEGALLKANMARDEAKAASRPVSWTPTAIEVGARPEGWLPTKGDVGLGNVENKSSAVIRSEITKANVTDTGLAPDDIGAETPTGAQTKADVAEAGAKAASRPVSWTPTATEVGARPDSWTPSKADVGLGNVENKSSSTIRSEITKANVTATGLAAGDVGAETPTGAQSKADAAETNAKSASRPATWMPSATEVGADPAGSAATAEANAKAASRPVTWTPTAGDVGARPDDWVPNAVEVGARPDTWTPTKADVGLGSVENKSSATIRSEITKTNVTATGLAAGDIGAETPAGAQTKANTAETNAKAASRPATWTPNATEVGARPDSWTPTKADVGLGAVENKSSATIRSEITAANVPLDTDLDRYTGDALSGRVSRIPFQVDARDNGGTGGYHFWKFLEVRLPTSYDGVAITGNLLTGSDDGRQTDHTVLQYTINTGNVPTALSNQKFNLDGEMRSVNGENLLRIYRTFDGTDYTYTFYAYCSNWYGLRGDLEITRSSQAVVKAWQRGTDTGTAVPSGDEIPPGNKFADRSLTQADIAAARSNLNVDQVENKSSSTIRSEITKANVTSTGLAAGDIGAETPSGAQAKANTAETNAKAASRPVSWTPSAAEVGARSDSWMPTANEVGARPSTWLPTKSEIGLGSVENKSSATIRSEITKANVTATGLAAGDIGAETPAAAQSKADAAEANAKAASRPVSWTPTAAEVGARPSTWMPNAEEVGARPETWTPTKADIGLGSVENKSSATIRSEITKSNVTATGLAAVDVGAETPTGAETTALSKIASKVGEDYEIEAFKKGNLINNPSQTSLASAGWTLTHELDPTSNPAGVYSILGGFGVRPGVGQDVEEIEITTERTAVNLSIESHSVKIDANQLYRFFTEYGLGGMNPDSLYGKDYRISFRFFDYNGTELAYRTYNPATKAYTSASMGNPVTTWLTPPVMTVWGDLTSLGCFLLPANIPVSEIPNVSGNASYHAEIPSGALKVSILFEWILATEEREAFTPVNCDIINGKPSLVATSGGPRPVETVDPANIAFRSVAYSCWMTGNNYVSVGENYELVLFKYGYQGQTANIYLRLPRAANMKGRTLMFRIDGTMGPGSAYLDPDGQVSGQRLNGSTATVALPLSSYSSFMIRSDGLQWLQIY